MIKKYQSMSITEIKKILIKKGFKIYKLKKNTLSSRFKSLYLSALASLFIIGISSILPSTFQLISGSLKKNKVVENYSKKYLDKALSGEKLISDNKIDEALDERHLYEDVEIESGPSKSVRIEASILNQVFEDDNYNLKKVRK